MRLLKLCPLILALCCLLPLSACAGQKAGSRTLRLGVMYSADILPLAAIQQRGLDKKYGFSLDMQVFSSARDRDAALQAEELDGVFTDFIGVCIYQNAGLDIKITGVTDGDYLLLAGADTGIRTLEDAGGMDVAVSENTLIEYAVDFILSSGGYAPGYLKKQPVPRIPDRLELLRTGGVSLCLLPEPFAALALEDGAVLLGSANRSGLYPAVSAFRGRSLREKGESIHRFYAAYDEAADYLNGAPPAEYEDALLEKAGFPQELKGKTALPVFRKSTLPSESELREAIRWAAGKGLCSRELTPGELLDNAGAVR